MGDWVEMARNASTMPMVRFSFHNRIAGHPCVVTHCGAFSEQLWVSTKEKRPCSV
jgi:hypothetical protein